MRLEMTVDNEYVLSARLARSTGFFPYRYGCSYKNQRNRFIGSARVTRILTFNSFGENLDQSLKTDGSTKHYLKNFHALNHFLSIFAKLFFLWN